MFCGRINHWTKAGPFVVVDIDLFTIAAYYLNLLYLNVLSIILIDVFRTLSTYNPIIAENSRNSFSSR